MHKYYQPVIHNHINGGLRTKGKKGTGKVAKAKPENGMSVGIYYGPPPHTRAGSGRKDPSFRIVMTVIVWSSDVCLETTHSRTRRPHSSVVHASQPRWLEVTSGVSRVYLPQKTRLRIIRSN